MITEIEVQDIFREHVEASPLRSILGRVYDEIPRDATGRDVVARVAVSDLQGRQTQIATVFLLVRVADTDLQGSKIRSRGLVREIERAVGARLESGHGPSYHFELEAQSCFPSEDAISHTISNRFTFYYNEEK